MYEALELFEKKYALQMIMTVRDNPGFTKIGIIESEEGNNRTKYLRINEMIENGIIFVKDERNQYNSMRLYLTPKGQEIATYLEKIIYSLADA